MTRTPLLGVLDVEMYLPIPRGYFQLDVSRLDHDRLAPAEGNYGWVPWLGSARSVRIRRGAAQDDVTASVEVGTLSLVLVNEGEPGSGAGIRPRVPIRARLAGEDGPMLFTGVIVDVDVAYDLDKSTNITTTITTIQAVDAVQAIANTPRYGAVIEDDRSWETWEARIHRYMRSTTVPYEIPPEGTLVRDEQTTLWADFWDTPRPIPPGHEATKWHTLTRDGAPIPGAPFSHGIIFQLPGGTTLTQNTVYGWRVLTGLIPGRTYRIIALGHAPAGTLSKFGLSLGAQGVGGPFTPLDPLPPPWASNPPYRLEHEFTATDTEHTIGFGITNPQTTDGDPEFWTHAWMELLTIEVRGVFERPARGPLWVLGSTVYESSLANHLDVACNSVRAVWWVDATGTVQFVRELDFEPPHAHFSDRVDPYDPLHRSYTHISATHDTRATVNNLSLANHGRARDPETGNWQADDRTYGPFRDATSEATVGPRSARVDTMLWSPPHDPGSPYHGNAASLAASYLADHSHTELRIRSLRFDAWADPELAAGLDIYSAVRVQYRDHTQTSSVIGIEHDITPDRWTTTLDLIRRT